MSSNTTWNIPSCGSPCPTQVSLSYIISLHPVGRCLSICPTVLGLKGPQHVTGSVRWRGGAGPRSHCQA